MGVAVYHHRQPATSLGGLLSGDSMNFDIKPVLEESAYFWFDETKKEGLEFYGPDTSEWLQFDLDTKRAFAAAQKKIIEDGVTSDEEKSIIQNAAAISAWKKALPKAFKNASNITLGKKAVTKDNCAGLFAAMSSVQIIQCGNFVLSQDSFLGKQSAD